jgi:hypothetical protein
MHVEAMLDHNLVGMLGWWWSGCVRKRRTIRVRDTKTFDRLVPFLRPIDPLLTKPFGGVSLIAISTVAHATALSQSASGE